MPTRIEKVQAYAEHLLDIFVGLRERYAIVRPMIFDKGVMELWGSSGRARGFLTLKNTAFTSCIMDISKITEDSDDRTPSVGRLVDALNDPAVRQQLREAFAVWGLTPETGEDPEVIRILQGMERREEDERRTQFDDHVKELELRWQEFKASKDLASCRVIRDKLLAHNELHHDGAAYHLFDVSTLGLQWGALDRLIEDLQRLVELITLIFRNAAFAFDMLDEQLNAAARGFWTPHGDS